MEKTGRTREGLDGKQQIMKLSCSPHPQEVEQIQGVAVDWIFSSRIKFVGLEPILGDTSVVGGAGLFLTFWRSLGGSLGEQVVFMKTRFVSKNTEKSKILDNIRRRNI